MITISLLGYGHICKEEVWWWLRRHVALCCRQKFRMLNNPWYKICPIFSDRSDACLTIQITWVSVVLPQYFCTLLSLEWVSLFHMYLSITFYAKDLFEYLSQMLRRHKKYSSVLSTEWRWIHFHKLLLAQLLILRTLPQFTQKMSTTHIEISWVNMFYGENRSLVYDNISQPHRLSDRCTIRARVPQQQYSHDVTQHQQYLITPTTWVSIGSSVL